MTQYHTKNAEGFQGVADFQQAVEELCSTLQSRYDIVRGLLAEFGFGSKSVWPTLMKQVQHLFEDSLNDLVQKTSVDKVIDGAEAHMQNVANDHDIVMVWLAAWVSKKQHESSVESDELYASSDERGFGRDAAAD